MTILLSRARMRILACSARVLFCVGVWLPAIGLRAEVAPTTAWAVRAGGILRVDADGVPLSFFSVENILKDVALNSSGSVLLAAELGGVSFGGFTLPRPNGQNIAAMLKLKPDLTPDLARSVSGLKGLEFATPTRVALSESGDALLAGKFLRDECGLWAAGKPNHFRWHLVHQISPPTFLWVQSAVVRLQYMCNVNCRTIAFTKRLIFW